MKYKLKALTHIWTGDAGGKPDKLHITGIKGSIRWWYEALIRGLDGYACDPTEGCLLTISKEEKEQIRERTLNIDTLAKAKICPACYLFGCTGWGSKFIIRIIGADNKPITRKIEQGNPFILNFVPIKPISEEEKQLIEITLKLVIDYGAIGAKTALKPSENDYKNIEYKKMDAPKNIITTMA